jgi:hypothetical protein
LPERTVGSRVAGDWPVYVAFLPGVFIGIAAATDFGISYPDPRSSNAASAKSIPSDADGYVEGLA